MPWVRTLRIWDEPDISKLERQKNSASFFSLQAIFTCSIYVFCHHISPFIRRISTQSPRFIEIEWNDLASDNGSLSGIGQHCRLWKSLPRLPHFFTSLLGIWHWSCLCIVLVSNNSVCFSPMVSMAVLYKTFWLFPNSGLCRHTQCDLVWLLSCQEWSQKQEP